MVTFDNTQPQARLWQFALWLAIFTILYNFIEGIISIYFGFNDETLTLFGFGIDSFIEVMSGVGILSMVLRIRSQPDTERTRFERTALQITGASFYLLSAGLLVTAVYNLINGYKPESTLSGMFISLISIVIMMGLVTAKRKVGHALSSAPILADANCTMVCVYMSLVLLASSLIYQVTGIGFIDSLGAAGLVYFSVKEGRESFEKASGLADCCDDD
jgi:divalent metal cation (Fe/Co/Zn/Cd) transporter